MKTILLAVAISAGLAGAASAEIHGSWTAAVDHERPGRIYMGITRNGWMHSGDKWNLADLAGLTSAQVESDTQVLVQFNVNREAGTFAFEGAFKRGDGAGQFTFQPNPGYIDTLRSLGVPFEMHGVVRASGAPSTPAPGRAGGAHHSGEKSDEESLFTLAMLDVSTSYIRSMQAEGYRETLHRYMQMRIFNVTPEFIHELKDAGYSNIPADKLVALRVHGVDINYIRKMNAIE